jgi:uncharacterized protein YggT (Ycf19 family)
MVHSFKAKMKKYLLWLISFYTVLFVVYILGMSFPEWIPLGEAPILLTFFFAAPFGIVERVERLIGIHLVPSFQMADSGYCTGLLIVYISNIVMCVIASSIFAFVAVILDNVKARLQRD